MADQGQPSPPSALPPGANPAATDRYVPTFGLYVEGDGNDGVKPSTVDIGDLADVLSALEKSLAKPDSDGAKKRNQRIPVSLTDIKEGSLDLRFETYEQALVRQFEANARAIKDAVFEPLADSVRRGLDDLRSVLGRLRAKATFRIWNSDGTIRDIGTLRATAAILPVSEEIVGDTEAVGTVVDVGGKDPNVHVEFLGQSRQVKCSLPNHETQAIIAEARKMGGNIYGQFRFKGTATWDSRTGEIIKFAIQEAHEFGSMSPEQAFAELRATYGSSFDDIESADDYVAHLREDSQ